VPQSSRHAHRQFSGCASAWARSRPDAVRRRSPEVIA
jgi:hypothetical protein